MMIDPAFELIPFDHTAVHYAAITAVDNALYPDYARSPREQQLEDEAIPSEAHWERWLLSHKPTGQIIGFGSWGHTYWAFDPDRYFLGVYLLPEWQGQGHGRVLYNHLHQLVMTRQPHTIRSETRSDQPRGIRFLTDRGFTLGLSEHASRLLLADFQPDQYRAPSLSLRSIADLAASDPDHLTKLYALDVTVEQDVPWLNDFTPLPFEQWLEAEEKQAKLAPELSFIALDGQDYVGLSTLRYSKVRDDVFYTGLTGVLPSHRRRGLALSLKVASLAQAKQYVSDRNLLDTGMVITENEVNNPMYTINEKLGFYNYADWLFYTQEIATQ